MSKTETKLNGEDVKLSKSVWNQDLKRSSVLAENDNAILPDEKRIKVDRIRLRKYAMLFAYSGVGYFGLQRNHGMKTIEGDIMEALYKAKLASEEAFNIPQTIHFQRAARTDKGVSALKQVVSLKLPETATREDINKYLPDQIRILGLKRVTKGFNSKNTCDARTYSYTCPTFTFAPTDAETNEAYRLPVEQLQLIQSLLKQYEGTHRFHNFTSKKKPMDPSSKRYIMSFVCGEPFLHEGLEYVTLKVKGQSFMLHQIRKMVGVVIAICRGHTSSEIISNALGMEMYNLPMAPSLGLLLEQVHYDYYNEKYSKDGMHESLLFNECDEEARAFYRNQIMSYVSKIEREEKSMLGWLETMGKNTYEVREEKTLADEEDEEVDSDDEAPRRPKKQNSVEGVLPQSEVVTQNSVEGVLPQSEVATQNSVEGVLPQSEVVTQNRVQGALPQSEGATNATICMSNKSDDTLVGAVEDEKKEKDKNVNQNGTEPRRIPEELAVLENKQ